jgi:hypothetical protein
MSETLIKPKPLTYTKRLVDAEALTDLSGMVEEQGQIVIHVIYPPQTEPYAIRVWKSTFLFSKTTDHRTKLIHAENISISPQWTEVSGRQAYAFTLFFEAFPKSVVVFDLVEIIPQPGGFNYSGILRNYTDVYTISL